MITFLVSGIWHGANWTFILWGAIHGLLQTIEKALGWQKYNGTNGFVKAGRICVTFLLVSFAWVFFRMPTIGESFGIIGKMFSDFGNPDLSGMNGTVWFMLFCGLLLLFAKDFKDEFFNEKMKFMNSPIIRWIVYVIVFCMVLNFGVLDGGQFIYVNF